MISALDIAHLTKVGATLQQAPEESEKEEQQRRTTETMCRRSFLVFLKIELNLEVGTHHRVWWQHLRNGEDCIELSPRDHGKSHALARAYPIWKAKYDPWMKEIFILGADQTSAAENLEKIKEMLSQNASLTYLIPADRKGYFNSKTSIKLSNGVIIRARGIMSPLRGRHPQLIVMDDVLNEQNSRTKVLRANMKRRFYDMVMPMKDRGTKKTRSRGYQPQIIISGTAQDRDDLYFELLRNDGFKGVRQQAIIAEDTKEVLWAERYDYDALMKIRRIIGVVAFSKEYQNEPLADDSAIFPPKLFEDAKDQTISYEPVYDGTEGDAYLGADFSVPGDRKGDWTVYIVISRDSEGNVVLRGFWRARPLTLREQTEKLVEFCRNYQVMSGFLEANLFQRLYHEEIKQKTDLPLKAHVVTAKGKNSPTNGVLGIRTLLENGKIRFPYKTPRDRMITDHIIVEFNGLTIENGKIGNFTFHDDAIMGLWHAWMASKETNFAYSFD